MAIFKKNHKNALPLIKEAAKKGAELIVLPELFASCYYVTKDIWNSVETLDGVTVKWLENTSKRLGVYIGASCSSQTKSITSNVDEYDMVIIAPTD